MRSDFKLEAFLTSTLLSEPTLCTERHTHIQSSDCIKSLLERSISSRTRPFSTTANMTDPILQVAETLQTAHINTSPSPQRDINPSTAASTKEPVEFASPTSSDSVLSDAEEASSDEIPLSVLRPAEPRRTGGLPPLPDLRFEQSYLASIQNAQSRWEIAFITVKDHVCLPRCME